MNKNQSIDIIIALPTTLSCIILWDWLKLKSVIRLDTAYCNAHRESFAQLLQSNDFCIRYKVVVSSDRLGILNGLKKVGEKLRHVVLHNNIAPEQWQCVLVHCRHLVRLHLMCLETCKPDVWDILRGNRDLQSLEICIFQNETI